MFIGISKQYPKNSMQHSESLLTEILALLQTLNANVHDFQKQLTSLENQLDELKLDFRSTVDRAFPGELELKHAEEHIRLSRPNILRRAFTAIDRALS